MSKHDRIDDLEREIKSLTTTVGELFTELAALRDGLADEVRTRHVLVECDDGGRVDIGLDVGIAGISVLGDGRDVTITAGRVEVGHDATGSGAIISVNADGAELDITTGDTPYADIDTIRRVSIVATGDYGVVDLPSRRAFVEVNGVELAVPATTTS